MFPIIVGTVLALSVFSTPSEMVSPLAQHQVIAEQKYSLSDRYSNTFVNDVFADNILLTLAYMRGAARDGQSVDWKKVKEDYVYTMTLQPGETFAFHDKVLPEYQNKVAYSTHAHFDSSEGFESDGWLVADGVCHLASFMNMVSTHAGLKVVAPTPHDFAVIPEVPKQYGTAIYYTPDDSTASSLQNLYITNIFDYPVTFVFTHTGESLDIQIKK